MADSIDIQLVFSNIAKTFQHFLGDADVNKSQEAEIQATIKQLNDFEGSISSVIDARIAAALTNLPTQTGNGDTSLASRVTALEEGLQSLGHVFDGDQGADTSTDTTSGGQGSDTIAGGDTSTDTVSGGNGDDTLNGGGGADTVTDTTSGGQATDTVAGGQGDDTVGVGDPTSTAGGGEANDTVQP